VSWNFYVKNKDMKNIKKTERTLKALANKRRLEIVLYLRRNKEATVGEIANTIELSFKATSKHLGVLASADIVDKEQRSLEMWYYLSKTIPKIAKHISNSLE
jgi:DNA-binding transcriptional ArsR family regulator